MTTMLSLDRRRFLVQLALAGAATLVPRRYVRAAGPSDPVVDTTSGKIRGAAADGINVFKGVPYGASTAARTGSCRRKSPRRGAECARQSTGPDMRRKPSPAAAGPRSRRFRGPGQGAGKRRLPDAQPVDPGLDLAKRPVMVWFHGGGFSYGSPIRPRTDGANLARRGDVVVVTINHRLNIFGFLDLAEIGGEEFAHSGNAGVLDLVASLEWVRDNVANFGGDPGNVTIFGQSGGGGKVSALLGDAGSERAFPARDRDERRRHPHGRTRTRGKARRRGSGEVGLTANQLDKLQALPVERLLAAIEPAQKKLAPAVHPLLDRYGFGPGGRGP